MEQMAVVNGHGPSSEIAETDILFECPQCAKSLAIDWRGAGLMITCPDCGTRIQVPEPDEDHVLSDAGLDNADVESRHDVHIRNLTEALNHSREKIVQLMASLDETRKRRSSLEKMRVEQLVRMERVSAEMAVIQSALDRVINTLGEAMQHRDDDSESW
jgi:uncharacterized Zn finger protein (UPF0148 family)